MILDMFFGFFLVSIGAIFIGLFCIVGNNYYIHCINKRERYLDLFYILGTALLFLGTLIISMNKEV